MRVLAIADTHIPDFANSIPKALRREAAKSDLVIHAGDVTSANILEELAGLAPVIVALGNNDGSDVAAWGATPEVLINLEGVRAAVIHDAGPAKSRQGRLRRRFPDVRLVIFGHSHVPMDLEAEGQRILNPGSPTWKRRQPEPTYATIDVRPGPPTDQNHSDHLGLTGTGFSPTKQG